MPCWESHRPGWALGGTVAGYYAGLAVKYLMFTPFIWRDEPDSFDAVAGLRLGCNH